MHTLQLALLYPTYVPTQILFLLRGASREVLHSLEPTPNHLSVGGVRVRAGAHALGDALRLIR
jgi:hypothetical protein